MKIAFIYDRVNKFGGAERILLALHEIWPEAHLYTAIYNPARAFWSKAFVVIPSVLNKFPLTSTKHELFPLLTPYAFESFNFDNYDVVMSITSSDAKTIITKPQTLHICYCLTPTRYLWSAYEEYIHEPGATILNPFIRFGIRLFSLSMRMRDIISSNRPDIYLAISQTVAQRISRYYKKKSKIIYPPVDTQTFKVKHANREDFYLVVSRLVPYKKIDYVIETFNHLGYKLIIVGNGLDEYRLKEISQKNIEFIDGNLTDEKLCWYYQHCKALIFPGEEDFGLTVVEAQACGSPVIGYGIGGSGETIIPGRTGELFYSQTALSLKTALKKFELKTYSANDCRRNAMNYSKKTFQNKIRKFVINSSKKWKENQSI